MSDMTMTISAIRKGSKSPHSMTGVLNILKDRVVGAVSNVLAMIRKLSIAYWAVGSACIRPKMLPSVSLRSASQPTPGTAIFALHTWPPASTARRV